MVDFADFVDFAGVDLPEDFALAFFVAGEAFLAGFFMTFLGFATALFVVLLNRFVFFPESESSASSSANESESSDDEA